MWAIRGVPIPSLKSGQDPKERDRPLEEEGESESVIRRYQSHRHPMSTNGAGRTCDKMITRYVQLCWSWDRRDRTRRLRQK